MRAVKVRIICDGRDLAVGRFVARFVGGICRGIVDALKSPPPDREITFEVEGAAVRLWVDDAVVPMDGGQGFAQVIILDTLRGMLRHLKGIDPQGNVRIVTNLEARTVTKVKTTQLGKTVTLIPGDGIGPEITQAVVSVLEAAGFRPRWERVLAGDAALKETGTPLPDSVIESVERTRIALKGPLKTPVGTGYKSVNVTLRKHFNLYANFRPIQSLDGVETKWKDLDLVVIRENTEGLYSGIEHEVVPGVVESLKIITRTATERIAKFAFNFARRTKRTKITIIHKANIMKMSDGLFLQASRDIAKDYPGIVCDDFIVDNACMQLITRPERFDVLLLENLYGDIISDLAAGLVGGLGVVPGVNYGDHCGIFEAVHGTAPDIAGRGIANPIALLRSAVLLLEFVARPRIAQRVDAALRKVLREGKSTTPDLGGKSTTDEMCRAIIDRL